MWFQVAEDQKGLSDLVSISINSLHQFLKGVEIPHFGVKNDKMKILLSVFNVSHCSLVYLSNMRILINCIILVAMVTILARK